MNILSLENHGKDLENFLKFTAILGIKPMGLDLCAITVPYLRATSLAQVLLRINTHTKAESPLTPSELWHIVAPWVNGLIRRSLALCKVI